MLIRALTRTPMNTEEYDSTTIVSTRAKLSYVLVAICIAIVLVGVTFLIWLRPPSSERDAFLLACDTAECNHYAELLWQTVNVSLSPCEDFYAYICTGRGTTQSSPISFAPDDLRRDMLRRLLNRTLSEDVPPTNQSATQKATKLLCTCLNVMRENQTSLDPLRRLLANISTPWPNAPTTGIEEIAVDVGINWLLPSYVSLQLDPGQRDSKGRPLLTLRDDPYTKRWFEREEAMREEGRFKEFVAGHVKAFDPHPRHLSQMVDLVLEALGLAEGIVTSDTKEDTETVNIPQSLADALNARASWIGSTYNVDDHFHVTNTVLYQRIFQQYLAAPQDYFRHLYALRLSAGWSVVERLGRHVSKDLALLQYWSRGAEGYDYERDCFELINNMMGLALALPEIGEYPPAEVARGVRALRDNIAAGLLDVLNGSHVLDAVSWKTAAVVLGNMREVFFYPPQLLPQDEVDYLYRNVPNMVHPAFLDNWMDAMGGLRNVVANTPTIVLSFPALGIEPEYVASTHVLYVPATAMRFPFFSDQLVSAINYGGLGYGICKEYTECLFWDESPFSWLSGSAEKAYAARLDCLKSEFASNVSVTRRVTLDAMKSFWSLGAVFGAFKRDVGTRWSRLAAAPQFSDDQLFFVAMCFNLCSTTNSLLAALLCNVPLRNFPEFAKAFGCESGTPMNPTEKCYAW